MGRVYVQLPRSILESFVFCCTDIHSEILRVSSEREKCSSSEDVFRWEEGLQANTSRRLLCSSVCTAGTEERGGVSRTTGVVGHSSSSRVILFIFYACNEVGSQSKEKFSVPSKPSFQSPEEDGEKEKKAETR